MSDQIYFRYFCRPRPRVRAGAPQPKPRQMKRTVIIALEIDPTNYLDAEDSPEGAVQAAIEILQMAADPPEKATITCEGVTKTADLW